MKIKFYFDDEEVQGFRELKKSMEQPRRKAFDDGVRKEKKTKKQSNRRPRELYEDYYNV